MTFLKNMSPVGAVRDLRFFLATRRRHELWFMLLALAVTLLILFVFFKDSSTGMDKPYERNIIYVEQWPITRTDEQIKAQQKIDQAKKAIRLAELKKQREAKQAEFKRLDDKLESWGF
jgi:preprotein translocase subunit SecF